MIAVTSGRLLLFSRVTLIDSTMPRWNQQPIGTTRQPQSAVTRCLHALHWRFRFVGIRRGKQRLMFQSPLLHWTTKRVDASFWKTGLRAEHGAIRGRLRGS